ncbi:MAG TPA: triose-phosphate isomerase [Bacteroidales bacterium]|nr:triose-phosphate isomerase [Bacteroidales bacterium]
MRKKIIAGNWKMNTTPDEGVDLALKIYSFLSNYNLDQNCKVILGVPFTHIDRIIQKVDSSKIAIAAQNCSQFDSGAYTGEISVKMVKNLGANYIIIGHSERRQYFSENNELLAIKLRQCYNNNINPIYCCGETLSERDSNRHFEIVKEQIIESFKDISESEMLNTIIAYEPVWAIGTGRTATPSQAQEMHNYIRLIIKDLFNQIVADEVSILYGGSVNSANASELFKCADIDGGLVGGASLKPDDFINIIKSAK